MTDFSVLCQPHNSVIISTLSLESCGAEARVNIAGSMTLVAWPTANKAIYVPFVVYQPVVATKMFVEIGTASGNIDVGIYDGQKNRMVSGGGVAQAGASAIQAFDITDTILGPGAYYMGVAADNTTGTVLSCALTNLVWAGAAGLLMQTTAYPLPSPANWVAAVNTTLPIVVILARTTV